MHPSEIKIGQTELSVIELYKMMQSSQLIITLDSGTWGAFHNSMSVESILLGLTMTPIYVDASIPNEWLVLDGGKRLDALNRFISNEFELTDLEFLNELNSCYFSNLPKTTQRRLLQSKFTIYSINQGVSPEVRLSLIRRIVPDIKSGLSTKMLERLFTSKTRELIEDLSEELGFVYKLFNIQKEKDDLDFKIQYLNILYSVFMKDRFENYDINSDPEDVIIFTNKYNNSNSQFIIDIWNNGLSRIERLLVSCEITPEVNHFLTKYLEYFIICFGEKLSYQEFDVLFSKNQELVWEIAEYLKNKSGMMHFRKLAKQKRINQIYKLIKDAIK